MNIQCIVSNRKIDEHHANSLVYEWEDELCTLFEVPLAYNHKLKNERYSKYIPFLLNWLQTDKSAFAYEMCTYRHNGNNKRNIVPCIIDFYIRGPWKVKLWYYSYWKNPAICVSSKEVYEYLTNEMHLKKIYHLPLSLSDKYRISKETVFEKKYDLFIAGRQNPTLAGFFREYLSRHPETTFVRRELRNGISQYFNQSGECVSETDSREIYVQLIRQARACMYAVPGIDGAVHTHGFSQVTPRFLEIIAAGCFPLLRYVSNADTDFYQLSSFASSIQSYEDFENQLDIARKERVDMEKYSNYLQHHYTSVVAEQLRNILTKIE